MATADAAPGEGECRSGVGLEARGGGCAAIASTAPPLPPPPRQSVVSELRSWQVDGRTSPALFRLASGFVGLWLGFCKKDSARPLRLRALLRGRRQADGRPLRTLHGEALAGLDEAARSRAPSNPPAACCVATILYPRRPFLVGLSPATACQHGARACAPRPRVPPDEGKGVLVLVPWSSCDVTPCAPRSISALPPDWTDPTSMPAW